MTAIPASHIVDAQQLQADGKVDLFELTPSFGHAVVRFTSSVDTPWQGNTYSGIPASLAGDKRTVDNPSPQPRLTIGQQNINLSPFKAFIADGSIDNAQVRRLRVLVTDLKANNNIYEEQIYRVRRVEAYGRTQIVLQLSAASDSTNFTMPYRQFIAPAFPSVTL